jgi:hypothetical protein
VKEENLANKNLVPVVYHIAEHHSMRRTDYAHSQPDADRNATTSNRYDHAHARTHARTGYHI